MSSNSWSITIADLRKELASTEDEARQIAGSIGLLRKNMEAFKIEVIRYYLEQQRKTLACSRGFGTLIRNREMKRYALLTGVGSFILGGIIGKDPSSAIAAGLTGLESLARGLGETRWYVLLGSKILVVPEDEVKPGASWVTLKDLTAALDKLMRKAPAGVKLGSLDDVISRLSGGKRVTPQPKPGIIRLNHLNKGGPG